ncbi:MAG: DNA primase [Candidatus Melainabacteria bacterium RIFOXYA2_FULL_32_9]|nr:MAG: DNA primase [Candidatus Melainabacteria bacterium RIFOXYA2_FULL_32_9]
MSQNLQSKTQDVIFEIKNRLDIVDTVSEHVVLKKSGRNYWGLCPFHKEKTPSFSVNHDKNIFKCFGCGVGGDSISFLMKLNNSTFYEVIADLAQKYGLQLPSFDQSSEKTELREKIYDINKKTVEYYTNLLLEAPEAASAREYLAKREINKDIIEKFNLGFSLKQADGLINHLVGNFKTDFDLLDKAGLISKRTTGNGYCDRFRNRIMIPIQDEKGNFIAFGARALEDSQNPKYLNSPDTLTFNKSRSLFALYQAKESIRNLDNVIIMEGYFDVISAHTHGLTNVVATLGTALTEQHLKILARYTDSRRIYLAFDVDEAGVSATNRGAEIIKSVFDGLGDIKQFDENFTSFSDTNNRSSCEIRVVPIPTGKDPDEFIRTDGIDAYKKLVNQAPLLIDYQINRIIKSKDNITSPQDKAHLIKQLIPVLTEIKNSIILDEYIHLVAERLQIHEESLAKEVKKSLQKSSKNKSDVQPIVNKKLEKHILAQKNLLSLYFINSDKLSILCINNYLKEVNFTDSNYLLIKNEIDKIIQEVSETMSAEELNKELLIRLMDNEAAKQIVVDINFSLDDKKDLSEKLLLQFIQENILYINQYINLQEQEQLKTNYHAAKNDELSSLQLQYKVRELIQLNNSKLEIINNEQEEE